MLVSYLFALFYEKIGKYWKFGLVTDGIIHFTVTLRDSVIYYLIGENLVREILRFFFKISSLFPDENFP